MTNSALSPICRCGVIARQRQAFSSRFSLSPVLHHGSGAIQRQPIFTRFSVQNPQKSRIGGPMGPVVVPWVVPMIAISINALRCFLAWDHRDHQKCSRWGEVSGSGKRKTPAEIVALRFPLQIFSRNPLYMSGPVVPSYLYPATTRVSAGPPWDHHGTTTPIWWSHHSLTANDSQSQITRELHRGGT